MESAVDISYLIWLQGLRELSPAPVRAFFSFLGSDAVVLVVLIVPCLAYWCLDKKRGLIALWAYGASSICNQLIKNTVCCYRPWVRDARVTPDPKAIPGASGYSFPSGHSQASASMIGGLGWLWRKQVWPLVAAVVFTVLMAFSRNYLGVHTPQDILVGIAEGFAFVLVAERLLAWTEEAYGRDLRVLVAGFVVLIVFMVYTSLKPYPRDYVAGELLVDPLDMLVDCYKVGGSFLGILVGWFVERRWVRFGTQDLTLAQGAARMGVGLVIVVICYLPIGHALVAVIGELAGQFMRHLLVFLTSAAGIPALFPRLDQAVAQMVAKRG